MRYISPTSFLAISFLFLIPLRAYNQPVANPPPDQDIELGQVVSGAQDSGAGVAETGKEVAPAEASQDPSSRVVRREVPLIKDNPTGSSSYPGVPVSQEPQSKAQTESAANDPRTSPQGRTASIATAETKPTSGVETPPTLRTPAPTDGQINAPITAHEQRQAGIAKTVKERALQLLSGLRGDSGGDTPPGAAVQSAGIIGGVGAAGYRPLSRETPSQAQALAQFPNSVGRPSQLVEKARGLVGLDLQKADQLLSQQLEQNPDHQPALHGRALVRRQLRRFEASNEDAKKALAIMPVDSTVRRAFIENLVDLGRSQEALVEADAALKAYGRDPHVLAGRASAKASMGDRQGQLADLTEAARLNAAFDLELQRALAAGAPAPASLGLRPSLLRQGAAGLLLLALAVWFYRKSRGESLIRAAGIAMREEDRRAPSTLLLPKGYEHLGTIAQGGMGTVYKARDRALNRPVAIKRMNPELTENRRELERFIKEARMVAGLKHPNIVEIYAIEQDEFGVFLVFEYLEGQTLHARIGRGRLSPAETLAVLKQASQAVQHAHAQNVVHRDMKPANIMLTAGGVKVMDFGIARRMEDPLSTKSRVEVLGTPVYMAPEQEMGGAVGPAADVYALAGCAYEMLSGRPPFTYGGMMKAERRYIPLSRAAELPAAVDAVMDRALDPNPATRWQCAGAFYSALQSSLNS